MYIKANGSVIPRFCEEKKNFCRYKVTLDDVGQRLEKSRCDIFVVSGRIKGEKRGVGWNWLFVLQPAITNQNDVLTHADTTRPCRGVASCSVHETWRIEPLLFAQDLTCSERHKHGDLCCGRVHQFFQLAKVLWWLQVTAYAPYFVFQ